MKRAAWIGSIAGAVLVAGGVGTAIAVSQPLAEPSPTSTVTITPEPPAAPNAEATPTPATTDAAADAIFLEYVEEQTPDWTPTALPNMTDEQLIAAGHEACDLIAEGVPTVTLRLVPGEEPSPMGDYVDSSAIFNGAITAYCPELVEWPEG